MTTVFVTDKAPTAEGAAAQAVGANGLLFVSSQVAVDVLTGELVKGGLEDQFRQVIENLSAVLAAAGRDMTDAVKATVHLVGHSHEDAFDRLYRERVGSLPSTVVFVSALPRGALVAIELVARMTVVTEKETK